MSDHGARPHVMPLNVSGLVCLLLTAMAASACTITVFSEHPAMSPAVPPAPRNDCENEFASRLTAGLGVPTTPVPTPEPAILLRVMNACTADELIEADDHFSYVAGEPMAYLNHHRLFNGPNRPNQLVALCASDALAASRACDAGS